jgi:hypothetical protein
MKTLPKALDIHKQNIDDSHALSQQQKTCDHEWIKKEVEIGMNRYFKYCVKCYKKQQVKKNDLMLKSKESI